MTPIPLKQVIDCMGNGPKRPTSANQRSSSDAQPQSSRWRGVRSTTVGARSSPRLGSDIFVASRATFRRFRGLWPCEQLTRSGGGFVRSGTADQPTLTCVRLGAVRLVLSESGFALNENRDLLLPPGWTVWGAAGNWPIGLDLGNVPREERFIDPNRKPDGQHREPKKPTDDVPVHGHAVLATILLPNCLTRPGTGRHGGRVRGPSKGQNRPLGIGRQACAPARASAHFVGDFLDFLPQSRRFPIA
jgi:hypothetical protein